MHTVTMTRASLGPCAWITTECYGADTEFTSYIRPNPTGFPDHWARKMAERLKTFLVSPNQGLRVMVSDDSDPFYDVTKGEEIVGYAAWLRHRGTDGAEVVVEGRRFDWNTGSRFAGLESWLLGWGMWYDSWLQADKAYDLKALKQFITTIRETQARLCDAVRAQSPERGLIYLEELHCAPKFQRNGVGKRLVQQGLDQAKAENVPVCLTASVVGEMLYSRMGFRTVGMAYYDKFSSPAMVWYPPGWKGTEMEYFVVDGNLR